MGLDQYLYARKHVAEYDFYGEDAVTEFKKVKEAAGLVSVTSGEFSPVGKSGSVSVCVAYWRKANAVHGWFVRKCADGVDDCSEFHVSRESLTELRDLCERLLADKDEKKAALELPPTVGFFFGSQEIDEWYWEDLSLTVSQLNSVLNDWFGADRDRVAFFYQASW